jgi:cytoplasmic iron level regulating protein YaaA (DUF328/UPF0246 family)
MLEHVKLFITHYNDYLDICLGFSDSEFSEIKKVKDELKLKFANKEISEKELLEEDAILFYKYLIYLRLTDTNEK